MNFAAPPIRRYKNKLPDSGPTRGPSLINVNDLPRLRKPYGLPRVTVEGLYRDERASFTQLFDPADRGLPHQPHPHSTSTLHSYSSNSPQKIISPSEDERREQAQAKKARQWRSWKEEVIPSLVRPFLAILRCTDSFRLPIPSPAHCTCVSTSRRLQVTCVYFNSQLYFLLHCLRLSLLTELDSVEVVPCHHASAAIQLVQLGLFPCAPLEPSLAVDMSVLQFASQLFMRSSPNVRAFADTLDTVLSERQYKLTTRVGSTSCICITL
jgi:hypothetical protein